MSRLVMWAFAVIFAALAVTNTYWAWVHSQSPEPLWQITGAVNAAMACFSVYYLGDVLCHLRNKC